MVIRIDFVFTFLLSFRAGKSLYTGHTSDWFLRGR
jgi:hypothetical protein